MPELALPELNLLNVSLVVANVVGVAMLFPQAIRLHRTGQLGGISPHWIGFGLMMNAGWLVYGLVVDLPGLIPVSAAALAVYVWIYRRAMTLSRSVAVTAATTAASLAVGSVVVAVFAGVTVDGIGLGLLYTVQFLPAAIEAVTADDLSGLAPATWGLALLEAVIWTYYGSATGDLSLLVGGVGAAVMSSIVLVAAVRFGRTRPMDDRAAPRTV